MFGNNQQGITDAEFYADFKSIDKVTRMFTKMLQAKNYEKQVTKVEKLPFSITFLFCIFTMNSK
jgi:hypothetical protein